MEIEPNIEAYERNEIAADLAYKRRLLTVRGKIARFGKGVKDVALHVDHRAEANPVRQTYPREPR